MRDEIVGRDLAGGGLANPKKVLGARETGAGSVLMDKLPEPDPGHAGELGLGHFLSGKPFTEQHAQTVTSKGTECQPYSDRRGVPFAITVTAMDTDDAPVNRLGIAMKHLGLGDSDVARATGDPRQAIHKLRHGTTRMSLPWAQKLERCIPGMSAAFLMGFDNAEFGEAGLKRRSAPLDDAATARPREPDEMTVLELDVRAAAGPGNAMPDLVAEGGHAVLARWQMPANYLRANAADPTAVRIIRVAGDSMEPDYLANDRVLVDTSHRYPSPDGIYVLWDGFGLILKRLALIYGSSPPVVRISSSNPAYLPIERPVDDVIINGRVVGKWMWK